MIVRDAGLSIIGFIAILTMLGLTAKYLTKTNDSAIEEITEDIIENELEKFFDLDDHALDGKIDFSPGINA